MSQRPARGATESLLSIVLGLEAALIFFVALTLFGLDVLPPLVALLGGIGAIILLLLAARVVGQDWGLWFGWVLQVGLILLGFLLPALFVASGIFVAIWIYCFIKGRQLDSRRHAFETDQPEGTP